MVKNARKKECAKLNFEQLSYSMSVLKIKHYAHIQGKTSSLATAKLTIFTTDTLRESCFKFDLEQLFNGCFHLALPSLLSFLCLALYLTTLTFLQKVFMKSWLTPVPWRWTTGTEMGNWDQDRYFIQVIDVVF